MVTAPRTTALGPSTVTSTSRTGSSNTTPVMFSAPETLTGQGGPA